MLHPAGVFSIAEGNFGTDPTALWDRSDEIAENDRPFLTLDGDYIVRRHMIIEILSVEHDP